MKSFSCVAISCDTRDIEDPESINISICVLPTLPTMIPDCALMVATMIVLLWPTGMGMPAAPCRHPSVVSLPAFFCDVA